MNPNISLPQLPDNLDPKLRDYLFAWQKLITSKQLDDYAHTVAKTTHGVSGNIVGTTDTQTLSNKTFDNVLTIAGTNPRVYLKDTDASAHDFFVYVNANNFFILTDRNENGVWESPHPLRLDNDIAKGYLYDKPIETVEMGSNSNGGWYKFGNGLMICWKNAAWFFPAGQSTSQIAGWTFPKEFMDNSDISVHYSLAHTGQGSWVGLGQILQNGLKVNPVDRYHAECAYHPYYRILDTDVYVHGIAIGLWK